MHTVPRIVLCSRFRTTNDEGLARSLHLSVPRQFLMLKGPQSVLVLWSKVRHWFDRYLPSGFQPPLIEYAEPPLFYCGCYTTRTMFHLSKILLLEDYRNMAFFGHIFHPRPRPETPHTPHTHHRRPQTRQPHRSTPGALRSRCLKLPCRRRSGVLSTWLRQTFGVSRR